MAPLTDQATDEMSRWSATQATQVDFLPISTDALFQELWNTGVFQELNRQCSCMIDDYEEERLLPSALSPVLDVFRVKSAETDDVTVRSFLDALILMCAAAIERNQPVYFLF